MDDGDAPGRPGIPPRWTSSAKAAVGTSLTTESRVWFSIGHGIVDEIYHPRIDTACTRDMGLLLSGEGMFLEEKRDARSSVEWFAPGVPGFVVVNELPDGLRVTKEILTDPERHVLLQRVGIDGRQGGLHVTVLLAPHLANRGGDNVAWVGEYKGVPMLFASGSGTALALAADTPWRVRSAGYVGTSDGWQDVRANGRLTWEYGRAGPGNVALAGEVEVPDAGVFTLAVGFGRSDAEAGHRARASLAQGVDAARQVYESGWRAWHDSFAPDSADPLVVRSRTVLRVHESISFPGASIASLSIPWGFNKGDDDLGGYHLVWPRDMVEVIGGLLASGASEDALRGLAYLRTTQDADGHWAQNMWLDGTPYWAGVQMDETALPILAVSLARQVGCPVDLAEMWPMVRLAAAYIVRNGPVTGQDRWEEDAGYSPFTLAAEIAALVVAASMADEMGEAEVATFLRETADAWNDSIERWIYVADTPLAREVGVAGYYVRITPPDEAEGASPTAGWVPIKNRPPGTDSVPASEIVSPDALALVRFGLRDARDERIADTVRVIDHVLRADLPPGPSWRRYSGDRYGEHTDGSPFDGSGIGRPWPLLTGERAHYELAAGNEEEARDLFAALGRFAEPNGLLPEQVWDGQEIPERELFPGRPTGSAMPLAWAHAEYLKLAASLEAGRVFDMPTETIARYVEATTPATVTIWAPNHRIGTMRAQRDLRLHLTQPGRVRWTGDRWETSSEVPTATMLDVHIATLPTASLPAGTRVEFTVHSEDGWDGTEHVVSVVA